MRVVATAGHVDHGKSSLVLALTGTDPDRFPEEKARGLTIDLGFAFTTLPSGTVVGFVDVPGHVKFVKNMLAGVGAVEVAVLVVAANEGWMPQTEEHVQILELLGIEHGLVVLTKADTVDDETLELARLELADHVGGSALARWPVVAVDSLAGRGIDTVRAELDALLDRAPAPRDVGRPRVWIDRVFAPRGAGTVVTGTLTGGSLTVDDDVVIEPGARRTRIRAIQVHHENVTVAPSGTRVALNLGGVDHHDLHRGHAIVRPGQWRTGAVVDVAVRVLPGAAAPRGRALHAHVGSGEHGARLRPLDTDGRFARVRLDTSVPLAPGDRIVLRSTGRNATVAGAEVLDVEPARRVEAAVARLARPLPQRILDARPWVAPDDLVAIAGVDVEGARALARQMVDDGAAVAVGSWIVATDTLADMRSAARALVARHHHDAPTEPGLELARLATTLGLDVARVRAALLGVDDLVVDREVVRATSHDAAATDHPDAIKLLAALREHPFSPPDPASLGIDPSVVRTLVRAASVVELDGVVFAHTALDDARRLVSAALHERGALAVADIRDLLGSTRKYVLPIVARLDAEGVTRRRGDERVAGPRVMPMT